MWPPRDRGSFLYKLFYILVQTGYNIVTKKLKIKINPSKETDSKRQERLLKSRDMRTQVIPKKDVYTRKDKHKTPFINYL